MTAAGPDDVSAGPADEPGSDVDATADTTADATADTTGGDPPGRRRLTEELLLSLELVALAAFAFTRPVLDSFGRSPETFFVRGAGRWVIVGFGVAVTVIPAVVAVVAGLVARRVPGRARPWAQPALVGVLGGVAVWRLGQDLTGWPRDAHKLVLAGVLTVALVAAARRWLPSSGTFLRVAGVASVVFLAQFVLLSPVSSMIRTDATRLVTSEPADLSDQLGDDPPDVVLVTFDALPTVSLLDGAGHIDAELFPNLAGLAEDATWYRNHTSVAPFTLSAIPALLTGRYPHALGTGLLGPSSDENLFTLLGGTYDVHRREVVTAMCPYSVCSDSPVSGRLEPLLGDAVDHWLGSSTADEREGFHLPGLDDGYARASEWIDDLDLTDVDDPLLVFHHMMVPHEPWTVTSDGSPYTASRPPTGQHGEVWGDVGPTVGRQRHLLQAQAADGLLGRQLDALRAAGRYDDALIVVTADHGESFQPGEPSRALSEANAHEIMWTPLLVHQPGQTSGRIDDSDVRSVDVVPTIADTLGIEMPWEVAGVPVTEAADVRTGDTKPFGDDGRNLLRPAPGEPQVEVAAAAPFARVLAADPVPGSGPDAVWRRAPERDLFGRSVTDLPVGDPAGELSVPGLGAFAGVDPAAPPPIEILGETDLAPATPVAYSVNGTIAVVAEVKVTTDGRTVVDGLVPPRLVEEGDNEIGAFVVDGEPGEETLLPLVVVGPET